MCACGGGGRVVCAGGVCSVHNRIRLNAADVDCQLNLYELHIIASAYFIYNEQIISIDLILFGVMNRFAKNFFLRELVLKMNTMRDIATVIILNLKRLIL